MPERLSPSEALAFRQRWAFVAERTRGEQAASTLEQRLDELERLMLSVEDFGWAEELSDVAVVRARWAQLRDRLGAASTSV